MIHGLKVIVVMPAYNAALTLEKTVSGIDRNVVDDIIVVDDCSSDATVAKAKELGLFIRRHEHNLGYGGNQKSCYRLALERGADIVIMVHPDYRYYPRLISRNGLHDRIGLVRRGVGFPYSRRRFRTCLPG